MGTETYLWSAFTSLGGNSIDQQALLTEWQISAISVTLNNIQVRPGVDVKFQHAGGTLSGANKTELDGVVAAHTGTSGALPPNPFAHLLRPTFAIWAEENSNVSVSANNYEYSFGNGAVNSGFSDVPGIPMGVECTLIGIGVSSRGNSTGTNSISISVTKNGVVVGTSAIFSSVGQNVKVNGHTDITPDTVNFSKGDTLQFLTASATGTHDDVRVVAWFERTA